MTVVKATFEDPETGRLVRRCSKCQVVQDLEKDFTYSRAGAKGLPSDRRYYCRRCENKRSLARKRAHRLDPVKGPKIRASDREYKQALRESDPDRARRAQRKAYRKIRSDPKLWAKRLEDNRMYYRLRVEREEGRNITTLPSAKMVHDKEHRLRVAPLIEVLAKMAAEIDREADFSGKTYGRRGWSELGERLDVAERQLRCWRNGTYKSVEFQVADRILTNAGLMFWEVWSERELAEQLDGVVFDDELEGRKAA